MQYNKLDNSEHWNGDNEKKSDLIREAPLKEKHLLPAALTKFYSLYFPL